MATKRWLRPRYSMPSGGGRINADEPTSGLGRGQGRSDGRGGHRCLRAHGHPEKRLGGGPGLLQERFTCRGGEEPAQVAGIVQDCVGRLEFALHFLGLEGALGEPWAADPPPLHIPLPARMESDHLQNPEVQNWLPPDHPAHAAKGQRFERGPGVAIAFFGDEYMRAERAVDLQTLCRVGLGSPRRRRAVASEEPDRLDSPSELATVIDPGRAMLGGSGSTRDRVADGGDLLVGTDSLERQRVATSTRGRSASISAILALRG